MSRALRAFIVTTSLVTAAGVQAQPAEPTAPTPPTTTEAPPPATEPTAPAAPPPAPPIVETTAAPPPTPAVEDEEPSYTRSDIIFWTTISLVASHHIDHALRDDFGWPQNRKVKPPLPTLMFYPVMIGGKLLDMGPNFWLIANSVVMLGMGLGHAFVEPADEGYEEWTDRSNVFKARAPAVGVISTGLVFAVIASAGTHIVSNIVDGSKYGFTWKRVHTKTPRATTGWNVTGAPAGVGPGATLVW
jgi:hypothetical protein